MRGWIVNKTPYDCLPYTGTNLTVTLKLVVPNLTNPFIATSEKISNYSTLPLLHVEQAEKFGLVTKESVPAKMTQQQIIDELTRLEVMFHKF